MHIYYIYTNIYWQYISDELAFEIELRKPGGIEIVDDEKSVEVLPDFNLAKRHLVVSSFCNGVTIMHQCCIILAGAGSFNTPRTDF